MIRKILLLTAACITTSFAADVMYDTTPPIPEACKDIYIVAKRMIDSGMPDSNIYAFLSLDGNFDCLTCFTYEFSQWLVSCRQKKEACNTTGVTSSAQRDHWGQPRHVRGEGQWVEDDSPAVGGAGEPFAYGSAGGAAAGASLKHAVAPARARHHEDRGVIDEVTTTVGHVYALIGRAPSAHWLTPHDKAIRVPLAKYERTYRTHKLLLAAGHEQIGGKRDPETVARFKDYYAVDLMQEADDRPDAVLGCYQ